MVDLEVVAFPDAAQDRAEDRLVHVIHALAARAHQVMVVLGYAGHVRGHVARPFEPGRHPGLDLRFQGAVHRGQAEARMSTVQALVELLR